MRSVGAVVLGATPGNSAAECGSGSRRVSPGRGRAFPGPVAGYWALLTGNRDLLFFYDLNLDGCLGTGFKKGLCIAGNRNATQEIYQVFLTLCEYFHELLLSLHHFANSKAPFPVLCSLSQLQNFHQVLLIFFHFLKQAHHGYLPSLESMRLKARKIGRASCRERV